MHGMSDDTPRMSDTQSTENPFSIFGSATAAEVALAAAIRRAGKLRDSGKWSAKYEADLDRCREAVAAIRAAVTATWERVLKGEPDTEAAAETVSAPPPAPAAPAATPDAPEPAATTLRFERDPLAGARRALVDHALDRVPEDAASSPVLINARQAHAAEALGDMVDSSDVCEAAGDQQWRVAPRAAEAPSTCAADVRVKLAMLVRTILLHRGHPHELDETTSLSLVLAMTSLADLTILDGATLTPPAECLRPVTSDADVAFWRQKDAEANRRKAAQAPSRE
jgi:hypothetical protein